MPCCSVVSFGRFIQARTKSQNVPSTEVEFDWRRFHSSLMDRVLLWACPNQVPPWHSYLYGLLLLVPLWIVIFILWRHQRRIKGNKPGPAEPRGGRNLTLQDQDGEPALHYASILPEARDPKPKTKQPRKQIPEGQSTEYTAIVVKNTPQANPVRLGQDRAEPYVCYATLRMSPAQTRINDPGGTGQDQQEPETTYASVRVAERKAKVSASHDAPRDQG